MENSIISEVRGRAGGQGLPARSFPLGAESGSFKWLCWEEDALIRVRGHVIKGGQE